MCKDSYEQLRLHASLSREIIYRKGRPNHISFCEDVEHHGLYEILFSINFVEKILHGTPGFQ